MYDKAEAKSQLNVRMPEAAYKAIVGAAKKDGKATADFVRIAALAAVCHSRRGSPLTVFISPREDVALDRARSLGMSPVVDVDGDWNGEVRVPIGKNGLFEDTAGGVWVLTPEGLKQVMSFEPEEEGARLAARAKSRKAAKRKSR